MEYIEEPKQTYCQCGKPLTLYTVPTGHVALPIQWIKNGCDECKKKLNDKATCKRCGRTHGFLVGLETLQCRPRKK